MAILVTMSAIPHNPFCVNMIVITLMLVSHNQHFWRKHFHVIITETTQCPGAPDGFDQIYNGQAFRRFFDTTQTYDDAGRTCRALGGTVPTITDEDSFLAVRKIAGFYYFEYSFSHARVDNSFLIVPQPLLIKPCGSACATTAIPHATALRLALANTC